MRKGQVSIEYLIVVGFVTFLVIIALGTALFYSSIIKDTIKFNQIEKFANKITSSAESIFYAGTPSRTTIIGYIPEGVRNITISNKDIIFEISTNSGVARIAYGSNVVIQGTISNTPGVKVMRLDAENSAVRLTEE